MISNKKNNSLDYEQMEEWLKNYFLDPLTSFMDQIQFRIDLYETDRDWIVEAILTEYHSSEISVFIEKDKMTINAKKHPPSPDIETKERVIDFPFDIINQKTTAAFANGILEVFISKNDTEFGKNRYITLP